MPCCIICTFLKMNHLPEYVNVIQFGKHVAVMNSTSLKCLKHADIMSVMVWL